MQTDFLYKINKIDTIFTTTKNGKKICTTPCTNNGFLKEFRHLTKNKTLHKYSKIYLCEKKRSKKNIIKIWMKNVFDEIRLSNKHNGYTISLDSSPLIYIDNIPQIDLESNKVLDIMSHHDVIRLLKNIAFGKLLVYLASPTTWNLITTHIDFAESSYNRYKNTIPDGPITHYIVGIIGKDDTDTIYIDGLDLEHMHNTLEIIKKAFKSLQFKIRRVCKIRKVRYI